jgi:hypothetical protein
MKCFHCKTVLVEHNAHCFCDHCVKLTNLADLDRVIHTLEKALEYPSVDFELLRQDVDHFVRKLKIRRVELVALTAGGPPRMVKVRELSGEEMLVFKLKNMKADLVRKGLAEDSSAYMECASELKILIEDHEQPTITITATDLEGYE